MTKKPARRTPNTPAGWISPNDCGRWSMMGHEEDEAMFSYVAAVGGATPTEIANAVERRQQTKLVAGCELPLNGSPGFRERYYGEETVVLEGAEERVEFLRHWHASPEIDDFDRSRLEYQIEALTKDIECARQWKMLGVEFGPPWTS